MDYEFQWKIPYQGLVLGMQGYLVSTAWLRFVHAITVLNKLQRLCLYYAVFIFDFGSDFTFYPVCS